MVETGVIHGRFQVLHLKHMEYLLAAKMRCKKLYVGISNPDDSFIRESESDRKRSTKPANPFTYFERMEMIRDALLDFGVKREEFDIIPFPISRPEYILQYAPKDATYFMSICDAWGEEKEKILTGLGVKVEVLWRKTPEEKGVTATEVRSSIVHGAPWKHLVPRTTYEYMVAHELDKRVCRLYEEALEEETRRLQEERMKKEEEKR
ncbi:MAG TPA: nicotinate-nucleotide adenylyltransferase [Lachnospiraceae bacterium]|nr:nicotinate-nucleotide adenylyltransferase [Lachnospiraceae bacterium]